MVVIFLVAVIIRLWKDNKNKTISGNEILLRMPLLHSYLTGNWDDNALTVMGLSSTGKTLSAEVGDRDYIKNGPEAYGFLSDPPNLAHYSPILERLVKMVKSGRTN